MRKKIIILDGNAIVHRAFHALPPLTSPEGKPTNAVYGFVTILLKIIQDEKPDYILSTFDLAGPTFRHVAFERYKATRVKAPDELYAQFPVVKEILNILHIPIYEKEGYEADDIIGTAARELEKKHRDAEIIIVTGDLDTLQLVTKRTKVFTMRKGISDTILYDEKAVRERYGFPPKFVADYKGLRGDPSDNIPGVKGIGEKTAGELIKKFGSIENIFKHLPTVLPESARKKLREQKEEAFFSRELATINRNVPIEIKLPKTQWGGTLKDNTKLRDVFLSLGFTSLLRRLDMAEIQKKPKKLSAIKNIPASENRDVSAGAEWKEVRDTKTASEFAAALQKAGKVSLAQSTEHEGGLFTIDAAPIVCVLPDKTRYRIPHLGPVAEHVKGIFEDEAIEKICFDSKKLALLLREEGILLAGVSFDIILAKYLLSAHERSYEAIRIAREYGKNITAPEDIALHLFFIENAMRTKLVNGGLLDILKKIELPLVSVLVEMEYRGVAIDVSALTNLSYDVSQKIHALSKKIFEYAGEEFNISSPQQVSRILFEKLGLGEKGLRKTKGGAESTRASELQKLHGKHPIVDAIGEYRELQKLKSTYIDALPTLVSPKDGRIHTTYNQTGTVTGRLSSSNPNLQNIPTRTELGKKIQSAFIASEGMSFSAFDYSQMQLRIAAHMSGDKKLIEAFRKGTDIHALTAAEINNIPLENVTPELRYSAKTLNFGVLYGMGARAFAESAGISLQKAKQFIEEYFNDFSGLRAFLDSLKEHAKKFGYVETLFGRRRYIPELTSPFVLIRREGERMAINMPIQGTEADIIKRAMITIYNDIMRPGPAGDIFLILQVHDELIFEIKKGKEPQYIPKIKQVMEQAAALDVPVVVDVHTGKSWGELKN